MDCRDWGLGDIMQLPDHCFGRRWPVICGVESLTDTDKFAIVRAGVPDRAVIHEIIVTGDAVMTMTVLFEFAWADQLVTTGAEWSALQKMFPCQGVQDGVDYNISASAVGPWHLTRLRLPSPASGLRPTMRVDGGSTTGKIICVTFVISSLPTEAPDWLCSR